MGPDIHGTWKAFAITFVPDTLLTTLLLPQQVGMQDPGKGFVALPFIHRKARQWANTTTI